MVNYGYITDNSYVTQSGDVVWNFERYNEDETLTSYTGIETSYNISSSKVFIIGNSTQMREWLYEFKPIVDDIY